MKRYVSRWLEGRLKAVLRSHPVVILTGPRQVGKSTLLENAAFLKNWEYITLDDPDALTQAREDPKGLLWKDKPTIIDEVQRCPSLLVTIKYIVDTSRLKRKFILSGSGNISLRKAPRETLAGRAKYLDLTGFGFREYRGTHKEGALELIFKNTKLNTAKADIKEDIWRAVWRGGLPGIVLSPTEKIALERLSGYVDTYLQRDIHDLVKIRHPQHFRRLMEALAQATGWESVQDELSKTCGEERSNVSRYISLMKETKLLYELNGYAPGHERAYRQSKYFWFDSGTACFLSGIYSAEDLKKPRLKGRYLENFIFQQILSWASLQTISPEIYYWRPKSGAAEVDFVVRSGSKVVGIEVKASDTVGFNDTRSVREFMKSHPEAIRGILVYGGGKFFPVATNIYAVPWTFF